MQINQIFIDCMLQSPDTIGIVYESVEFELFW